MPESYLRELNRLVGAANAHLGVVVSSNERHAYWIDGRSLGVLSWETVCGFTSTARAQLGYAEVQRASKLDELMVRRNKQDGVDSPA